MEQHEVANTLVEFGSLVGEGLNRGVRDTPQVHERCNPEGSKGEESSNNNSQNREKSSVMLDTTASFLLRIFNKCHSYVDGALCVEKCNRCGGRGRDIYLEHGTG